jgi:multisubunit Na+/H+ antiporter MnhC subunit
VYGAGVVLALLWVFAFFPLLDSRQPALIVLAIVVALAVHAMMYGPQAAFIAEQFPNRIRYAGASLAYTLAGIFGGGIAPLMFASLMKAYGRPFAISIYTAVALAITGVVLTLSRSGAAVSAAAGSLDHKDIARS